MTGLLVVALLLDVVAIRWAVELYEVKELDEKLVHRIAIVGLLIFILLLVLIIWSASGR